MVEFKARVEKTLGKTPDAILFLLDENSFLSIPELAEKINKSESAVERAIRKLREKGRLKRIGPAKGGHWKIIKEVLPV
jgi:predicted HTH transcriptional regulator